MFTPVPPDTDFVELEQAELARWSAQRVFERSMEQRAGARPWVFYEGPPTANGMPGLHHGWARVYKDLFCRFRTMGGAYVARRAGWDTHGLPVEVEVEKKLGITDKRQIEDEVGIAEFTRLCRESVYTYVGEFERLTRRIGYWVDMDAAYWTLSPSYIESVWWHLQRLFDQGLLYEDLKVVPYCPRCGTALSSHELGPPGVYTDEEDESAYVRLALTDADPAVVGEARWLSVWTTTPWTLLSNTGIAVNPALTYAVVDGMVMAEDLVDDVMGEGATAGISHRLAGSALVGLHYARPFDDLAPPPAADGWRVVPADYVTTEEGTGLVHLAPAFGEVDRHIGRLNGLPSLNPVGPDGRFTADIGWLEGRRCARPTRHQRSARGGRPAGAPLPLRALVPALLALPDAADLLGQAELVHRHLDPQGRPAGGQRTIDWHPGISRTGASASGCPTTSTGPCRATVTGGRRCPSGAAAAATCAASVRWPSSPSCAGATSPASTRTARSSTTSPSPARPAATRGWRARRGRPPGRAGHRRLVRLGLDAGGPGGLPACARIGRGLHLPGRLHFRGHRPDPGLVLLPAGRQHPGLRPEPLPPRGVPGPHHRRRRPQDVQVAGQHHRPLGHPRHPRAPTPCAGGCSARAHRGRRPGPAWAPSTPPCATCC